MNKKSLTLLFKAIPIGIANTLPGVSGGTIALVLKIYDLLVKSIKNIRLDVLIPIGLGALIGALISSRVITGVLNYYPTVMMSFLLGLILASTKITLQEVEEINLKAILLFAVGFFLAFIMSANANVALVAEASLWHVFIGGVLSSMAMILPGVSGGTILIVLGIYRVILESLNSFNLVILVVFALGVGLGLLIFSWLLAYLLDQYRSLLMALLSGLILGSLRTVLPTYFGVAEFIALTLGVIVIILMADSK